LAFTSAGLAEFHRWVGDLTREKIVSQQATHSKLAAPLKR